MDIFAVLCNCLLEVFDSGANGGQNVPQMIVEEAEVLELLVVDVGIGGGFDLLFGLVEGFDDSELAGGGDGSGSGDGDILVSFFGDGLAGGGREFGFVGPEIGANGIGLFL